MTDPLVEVEQGKLKGKTCKTLNNKSYFSFKSIPYAKPPVGELRFSAPVAPDPWDEVRDATQPCNVCAQFDRETNGFIGDEDCLYLNVYTPKLPSDSPSLLPVMFFIHGGGFIVGNGTDDTNHGPDYIAERDVVTVTINYRLGIFGFLSLDRKEAPGNMGLKDQVQALKWVRSNISNFGGDPNNVTIFGISAGGASVEYLVLSPMARGLFHKAIAQSGSSLLHWALNTNVKDLAATIPLLKIADDEQLLKFLKSLPAKDLVLSSTLAMVSTKFRGGIHFGFVPTIEKPGDWEPFLDKSPYSLLSKGEFTKVPFMGGFCTREGLLIVPNNPLKLEKLSKDKDFMEYLPFDIDDTEKVELTNTFKSVYLESDNKYKEADAFAIDLFTDVDFLGGIYVATSLIAKSNSPVYFYEFQYDGKLNYLKEVMNIEREGACHGDDTGYIVTCSKLNEEPTETDKLVRDRFVQMWTNFAKYGDPTPKTDDLIMTKWEPIAETGMACLCIDDKLTMKYDIYPARMKLFESLYEKYYK